MEVAESMAQLRPLADVVDPQAQPLVTPSAYILFRPAFGKAPEPAPDAGGRPPLQQHLAAYVAQHEHAHGTHRQRPLRPRGGIARYLS